MIRSIEYFAPQIGRILVGGYFLWAGVLLSLDFSSTTTVIAHAGLPMPALLAVISIVVQVVGGIFLILGSRVKLSAGILALYMLTAALLYTNLSTGVQAGLLLKDMAIIGGLLYIAAYR